MNAKATSQGFLTAEELLGGPAVLHPLPRSVLDWVSVIRQGISAAAVDTLTRGVRISRAELAAALGFPSARWRNASNEGVYQALQSNISPNCPFQRTAGKAPPAAEFGRCADATLVMRRTRIQR